MATITESLFGPSNRRRCVKGRTSLSVDNLLSIDNSKLDDFTCSEKEEIDIVDNFEYQEEIDEEPVTIDLSAFLQDNPLLTESATENAFDSGAGLSDCHSQFRVTSILETAPIMVDKIHQDSLSPENNSLTYCENSKQLVESSTEISSVTNSTPLVLQHELKTECESKAKENQFIFDVKTPKKFDSPKKYLKPKSPLGFSNPLRKYRNFSKMKEFIKNNIKVFGKYPVVKCEKLDIENYVKMNNIKISNWPLSHSKSFKKNSFNTGIKKKIKTNSISKAPKVFKPISFKKPLSKLKNGKSSNVLVKSFQQNSVILEGLPPSSKTIPVFVSNNFEKSSPSLIPMPHSVIQQNIIGSDRIIKIVTPSIASQQHINSVNAQSSRLPPSNVHKLSNNNKTFQIISSNPYLKPVANKTLTKIVSPIRPKPVAKCVFTPSKLDTSLSIKNINNPTSLNFEETASQSSCVQLSNELGIRNSEMKPNVSKSPIKTLKLNKSPVENLFPCKLSETLPNGPLNQIIKPITKNPFISVAKKVPEVEEKINETVSFSSAALIVDAMKNAFKTQAKKSRSKPSPVKKEKQANQISDFSKVGCSAYNSTLNDILFGFGGNDFTDDLYACNIDDFSEPDVSNEIETELFDKNELKSESELLDKNELKSESELLDKNESKSESSLSESKPNSIINKYKYKRKRNSQRSDSTSEEKIENSSMEDKILPENDTVPNKKLGEKDILMTEDVINPVASDTPVNSHEETYSPVLDEKISIECSTGESSELFHKQDNSNPTEFVTDNSLENTVIKKHISDTEETIFKNSISLSRTRRRNSDSSKVSSESPQKKQRNSSSKELLESPQKKRVSDSFIESLESPVKKRVSDSLMESLESPLKKLQTKNDNVSSLSEKRPKSMILSKLKKKKQSLLNQKKNTSSKTSKVKKKLSRPADIIREINTITGGKVSKTKRKKILPKGVIKSKRQCSESFDNLNPKKNIKKSAYKNKRKIKNFKVLFKNQKCDTDSASVKSHFIDNNLSVMHSLSESSELANNKSLHSTFREESDKMGTPNDDGSEHDSAATTLEQKQEDCEVNNTSKDEDHLPNKEIPCNSEDSTVTLETGIETSSSCISLPVVEISDQAEKRETNSVDTNQTIQYDPKSDISDKILEPQETNISFKSDDVVESSALSSSNDHLEYEEKSSSCAFSISDDIKTIIEQLKDKVSSITFSEEKIKTPDSLVTLEPLNDKNCNKEIFSEEKDELICSSCPRETDSVGNVALNKNQHHLQHMHVVEPFTNVINDIVNELLSSTSDVIATPKNESNERTEVNLDSKLPYIRSCEQENLNDSSDISSISGLDQSKLNSSFKDQISPQIDASEHHLKTLKDEKHLSPQKISRKKRCPKVKLSISKKGRHSKRNSKEWYISERKCSTDSTSESIDSNEYSKKKSNQLRVSDKTDLNISVETEAVINDVSCVSDDINLSEAVDEDSKKNHSSLKGKSLNKKSSSISTNLQTNDDILFSEDLTAPPAMIKEEPMDIEDNPDSSEYQTPLSLNIKIEPQDDVGSVLKDYQEPAPDNVTPAKKSRRRTKKSLESSLLFAPEKFIISKVVKKENIESKEIPKSKAKKSSSPVVQKQRQKNYSLEAVVVPFTLGWMRELVHRANDGQKGKRMSDVYYFSPEGNKLRSMPEISSYLSKHSISNLTVANFTFAKDCVYREPFEIERDAKQKAVAAPTPPKGKVKTPTPQKKTLTPKKIPTTPPSSKKKLCTLNNMKISNTVVAEKKNSRTLSKKRSKSLTSLSDVETKLETNSLSQTNEIAAVSSKTRKSEGSATKTSASKSNSVKVEKISKPLSSKKRIKKANCDNSLEKISLDNKKDLKVTESVSPSPKKVKNYSNKLKTPQSQINSEQYHEGEPLNSSIFSKKKFSPKKPLRVKFSFHKSCVLIQDPCTYRCKDANIRGLRIKCAVCLCLFHESCILKEFAKGLQFVCEPCQTSKLAWYSELREATSSSVGPYLSDESDFNLPEDIDLRLLQPAVRLQVHSSKDLIWINADSNSASALQSTPILAAVPSRNISFTPSLPKVNLDPNISSLFTSSPMLLSHLTRPTISHLTRPTISHLTRPTISHLTRPTISHLTRPTISHLTRPTISHLTRPTISHCPNPVLRTKLSPIVCNSMRGSTLQPFIPPQSHAYNKLIFPKGTHLPLGYNYSAFPQPFVVTKMPQGYVVCPPSNPQVVPAMAPLNSPLTITTSSPNNTQMVIYNPCSTHSQVDQNIKTYSKVPNSTSSNLSLEKRPFTLLPNKDEELNKMLPSFNEKNTTVSSSNHEKKEINMMPPPSWEMTSILRGYECLNLIFKKLNVSGLLKTRLVCDNWKYLASQEHLWKNISFQDLKITDWEKCCTFLLKYGTKTLDLCDIILEDSIDPWKDFKLVLMKLTGIRELMFDKAPPTLINAIAANMPQLIKLECFLFLMFTEPDMWLTSCELELSCLQGLSKLRTLKIGSLGGIILRDNSKYQMPLLPNLKYLSLTGFKFHTVKNLMALTELKNLVTLELGDCSDVEPEIYDVLKMLTSIQNLRLENGGCVQDNKLSDALTEMQKLEQLELMNFKIPSSLPNSLEHLIELIRLNIWPDNTDQGALVNYNLFQAVSKCKRLKYICWGVIAEGDLVPQTLEMLSMKEERTTEVSFRELFDKLVNLFSDCRVEVKCVPRSTWREFCSARK